MVLPSAFGEMVLGVMAKTGRNDFKLINRWYSTICIDHLNIARNVNAKTIRCDGVNTYGIGRSTQCGSRVARNISGY